MSGKCRSVRGSLSGEATIGSSEHQGRAKRRSARGVLRTARLTIDVTPALRERIKVIAVHSGLTVPEMLRELLEREFETRSEGQREV